MYLDKMRKTYLYFDTKLRTNNLCKVNQLCDCELPFYHLENTDFAIILTIYTLGLLTLILQIFIFAEFSTLEGLGGDLNLEPVPLPVKLPPNQRWECPLILQR